MLGLQPREPGLVHRAAAARREIPDQVDRQAVGRVQGERILRGHLTARAGAQRGELIQAAAHDRAEVTLLGVQQREHRAVLRGQRRVVRAEHADRRAGHLPQAGPAA